MSLALERHVYPFTAIVGQDRMKLALVLNAINPAIGGVLIRGEKGTGKSTAVRALARLLPEQRVVAGCHFGCDPESNEHLCIECRARLAESGELPATQRRMRVIELPINASEDRVVGTIDLEAALKEGSRRFEPGVLAEANRNILYVDEVNLLDDHIVDVLLDAAAMGVNVVEREGVSVAHPARFILVGTMNPEEGELRPQLLDRFGLCVDVEGIRDPDERVLVAERDSAFRAGDPAFRAEFETADANLSDQLRTALDAAPDVQLGRGQARLISTICVEAGVAGHRADVVIERTARALAAFRGFERPTSEEIYDAAELALAHRARNPVQRTHDQSGEGDAGERQQPGEETTAEAPGETNSNSQEQRDADGATEDSTSETQSGQQKAGAEQGMTSGGASGQDASADAEDTFNLRRIELPRQRRPRKQSGKRAASQAADRRGRYVRADTAEKVSDLAVDATIRAAAPHQVKRGRETGDPLLLERHDLREKVRERRVGNLIVFVVDASASMDAEQRMAATKGAILSLLQDAYVRRDRVAVVIFKNRTAEVVLRPTSSVQLAQRRLERLSVGGTTPLTHGLMAGYKVIKTELLRDPTVRPLLVLISDGRGNISMFKEEPLVEAQKVAALVSAEKIDTLVIDSARDFSHLPSVQNLARVAPMYQTYAINACADLAERMGARYYGLYDLSRDEIASAVERELRGKG
ncbi:MAG TPA: magnesium chelatase subunit D family protein [Candidatus Dormibacteraeota bacterium]